VTTNCVINVNFAPSNTTVMYKKGLNMSFGFVAMLVYICVSLFCCVFAGAVHVPCTLCKRSEEGIDSLYPVNERKIETLMSTRPLSLAWPLTDNMQKLKSK